MTSIAKLLAQDLDIRLQTRAKSIEATNKEVSVETDDGKSFSGNQLILTAPIPQSLALLKTANIFEIEPEIIQLQDFRYHACVAVLVLLDGPSAIPYPGGLKLEQGPIQWLGDNTQKGISPKQTAITIHASAEFSHQNFDGVTETIAKQLTRAAKPWLRNQILDWQVHKWRFSHPVQSLSSSFLKLPGRHAIFLAGDAFGAPRVEGAALSGMAVAQQIIHY
jgi:predicted NAD/FAD-dependent oxidoreductase